MKSIIKSIKCLLVFSLIFTMLPLSQVSAAISLDIGTNRINMEIGDDLDSYIWTPPAVVGDKLFIPWFDWKENEEFNTVKQYYSVVHSDGTVDTVLSTPVSPTTTDYSPDIFYKGLSNGNVLIYWYSSYSSNGLTDTYFKIIDPAGTRVVEPTKINSSPGSLNRFTDVTELSNSNLAFVWDTNDAGYALRRFTTTGVAVDADQLSITGLAGISGSQYNHRIAANNSGQFMISISYYNTNYVGMIFNDTGTTPIQVGGQNSFVYGTNTETPNGNQYVKALSNNKFLFVYHKKAELDVNTRSIYYRIYNADGTPYTNEMFVDTLNTWGAVNEPIITDDGFILSYSFNDNIVNNHYLKQYNNAGVLQSQSSPIFPELEGNSVIGFLFQDVDDKLSYIANEKISGAASYDAWLLRHLTSGPSSYNVTFEDWDGTELKTETVNHGSGATAPTNPSRVGYTFTGWDVAFGNITSALTVKAQYSVNSSYTVSFDSQGGSGVGDINATYGSKITAPTPPTRANYTFGGWYKESGTENQWNFTTETIPTNHVTLFANWILNNYTVTFEDWNGTVLKTETVNHGSGALAPTNPSRVGYNFTGWDVAFGDITGALTVKAQYSANSYTVSFDSQSGSAVDDITATYDSKITAPTDPTRAGYAFSGWYKEADALSQWNFATETIASNHITLYAGWILNSYAVTFEDWDGTELKTETVNHGNGATVPTSPSRAGYTFTGWDVAFGNITGALTVKAQYSVNSYIVNFDSQSGSAVADINITYGSRIIAPTPPTRANYSFGGWYKEVGTVNKWEFLTESMSVNDVTLYAKWIYRAPSGNGTESGGTVEYITITESDGTVQYNNNIKVNDRQEKIGILKITKQNGQDIATVTIDTQLLLQMLGNQPNAQITVPIDLDLDKVTLVLNGQLVKDLARKNIVIVLSTRDGQYKLPTSEIDMDIIAKQLGVESLETLALSIEISKLTVEEERLVANSLKTGDYTLVAPPVHFSVYVASGNQKIELSKFQVYIERFIALPDGADISKISTAVVIGKDGTLRHVPTKIEHMNGKNFAVIHSLSNSIYALIWNPVSFVDVENHWSKDAVNNMASRMIISGTGNGLFQPDKFISRAEFAATIVRALGIELEPGSVPFSDVNQTDWYFDYVKAAYEYGIINGYSDGNFKPTDTITREQVMSMLARAMKITGLTAQADIQALEKFTDEGQIATWAKNDVAITLQAEIVNGGVTSALKPKSLITRAEVATMIERLLKQSGMI